MSTFVEVDTMVWQILISDKVSSPDAYLTVALAQAQTGANRHTIKLHIKKLLAGEHLAQQGTGRGTWYSFKSVVAQKG